MAFNDAPGRAEYISSGGQTVFPFSFKIYTNEDIKVYLTPSGQSPDDVTDLLMLTNDYTVSINGDLGGTMTLVAGAGSGDAIVIQRSLAITRLVDYQTGGDLLAGTLNLDQNYQTYLVADQQAENNRYLTLPASSVGVDTNLPAPTPLNFLQWNNAATALINVNSLQADGFLWTAADVYTKDETYSKTEADAAFAEEVQITDGKKLWDAQTTTHEITTDADYTLTAEQNKFGRIVITDTGVILTVARNIITDVVQKDFIVQNDTLQDLTVKTLAGTGIVIKAGFSNNLYNDSTNIILPVTNTQIGVGQTWQNLTGSRTLGVTETNTTGSPIQVIASTSNAGAYNISFVVDGVTISLETKTAGQNSNTGAIVPNGSTYSAVSAGSTLLSWFELTE